MNNRNFVTLYLSVRHNSAPGKPDELYFLPEIFGTTDLLQPGSPEKLDKARNKRKTTG